MATWTHFTSYLDGSRPITKAERDELWDNFDAFLQTCCGYSLDATKLTELKTSGILTDIVPMKKGTAVTVRDSIGHAIVQTPIFTGPGLNILSAAATAEGLTTGQFNELFATSGKHERGVDDYRVWNILRRAIDALVCGVSTPAITSPASATATACQPFYYQITATGSPTIFAWTGAVGGPEFNSATGVISYTPTTGGVTLNTTIQAQNDCGIATQALVITVNHPNCPLPTLRGDSISATKSKVGCYEFIPSSPPKRYLTATGSGALTITNYSGPDCTECSQIDTRTLSGSCSYDRFTEVMSGTMQEQQVIESPCGSVAFSQTDSVCLCEFATNISDQALGYTATTVTMSGSGACDGNVKTTGSSTITLSDEYTTAQLIADAVSLLPAYPGTWSGATSALLDLSADEETATVRRFKYKFELPDLTGFTSYQLNWSEGGTPMSYIWDGVATETPEYGPVNEPVSPGSVAITGISATCSCA